MKKSLIAHSQRFVFLLLALSFALPAALADEGMWIPMLLGRNEAAMQKAGMRISTKDIYDINNACLKDAVILFNQGCTGEFVSDQGLFLTNHHCGYSYIVSHSTEAHNYLTNGFWAEDLAHELPCPGLTATRLVRMEDVTAQVLQGVSDSDSEEARQQKIDANIEKVTAEAVKGSHYKAIVKPFYYGNQYFMYVNEVFRDVRLVGAPPSNIGKFGGDTDNWMWPRHTGDFSIFRVYTGSDNKPADYSPDNKPYRPLKHLTISLKGVEEGDFTFVFGYPGTTKRYVTHDEVDLSANATNPIRIALRDIRLRNYKAAMEQSVAQRLKYSSRVASIANGWKKWQGETLGINRLHGVDQKMRQEAAFQRWAASHPQYESVLPELNDNYSRLWPVEIEWTYFNEGIMASDFMNRTFKLWRALRETQFDDSLAHEQCEALVAENERFFSDFAMHSPTDRAIFVETALYVWKAGQLSFLDSKYHGEAAVRCFFEDLYDNSILNNKDKYNKFLHSYRTKNYTKVISGGIPAVDFFNVAYAHAYSSDKRSTHASARNNINRLMRTYVRGMMEQFPDSNFFPDANLTLRVTYGHVQGFRPHDAVYYTPYSTLDGIIEKENPDIYDYVVEPRLKELYNNKDYGRYANSRGELPTCFIATNHTTGGNSGSPVLNADGQLIGINFDRCWEGTMSDLLFDPDYCRNISLDIRYCLFLIDKFAGAHRLIDEMTIVQ